MSNSEQWEFFGRIEKLEKATKELKFTEATALDGAIVGIIAFGYAFAAFHESAPHTARAAKDQAMPALKKTHLSKQMVDALEETMLIVCDEFEGRG